MNRRGFLASIVAAGVAPFVCRAESLMVLRVPESRLIVPEPKSISPFQSAIDALRNNGARGEFVVFLHPSWEPAMREMGNLPLFATSGLVRSLVYAA